jgi:hypothetical protein|tara:strand:+ start:557 stop:811 length:255 start_codon:yes stop_codon:yes gene_type:complete
MMYISKELLEEFRDLFDYFGKTPSRRIMADKQQSAKMWTRQLSRWIENIEEARKRREEKERRMKEEGIGPEDLAKSMEDPSDCT